MGRYSLVKITPNGQSQLCIVNNLLKTKRNPLYIRNQAVPRCKHFPPQLKNTYQFMMYRAKVAVCSQILTKHSLQNEQHLEFLHTQPGGTYRNR
jgi:hypothetical protein